MKVLVVAEINSHNLGDQAIHYGIKKYLASKNILVSSLDLSSRQNIDSSVKIKQNRKLNFFKKIKFLYICLNITHRIFIHFKNINLWLKEFRNTDLIIVGGGSLLINNSYSFPISLFLIKILSTILKKNYYVIGCSASENINYVSKQMLFSFLMSAKGIYLRDNISVGFLRKLYHLESVHSADLALLIDANHLKNVRDSKLFAINVIGFSEHAVLKNKIFQNNYNNLIVSLIEQIQKDGNKVILFTTGEEIDYLNAKNIIINNKLDVEIYHPSSVQKLLAFLSKCSGVISTRLHSAILAFVSETSTVSISWDKKIDGFFQSNDIYEDCFSSTSSPDRIISRLYYLVRTGNNQGIVKKNKNKNLLEQHIGEILNEKNSNFN